MSSFNEIHEKASKAISEAKSIQLEIQKSGGNN